MATSAELLNRAKHTCPLCGKPNHCAMEIERATGVKQPACWCTQATFSAELLAKIPATERAKSCLCADCASRHSLESSVEHHAEFAPIA